LPLAAHLIFFMTNAFQIPYDEIKEFHEVLAAGTAAALLPIKSITMKSKNEKISFAAAETEPGPVCVQLLETLRGIQQGKLEDKQGWLYKVEKPFLWGTGVFRAGP
jgi:branched-chain amino acid aminotransferase